MLTCSINRVLSLLLLSLCTCVQSRGCPWSVYEVVLVPCVVGAVTVIGSSSDNHIQVVELSGHTDLQIVVNTSLQTVFSTVFRI